MDGCFNCHAASPLIRTQQVDEMNSEIKTETEPKLPHGEV